MTCDRVRDWMSAEMDGEADAAGHEGVEAHLAACPGCRLVREAFQTLRAGLRTASCASSGASELDDRVVLAMVEAGRIRARDASPIRQPGDTDSRPIQQQAGQRDEARSPVWRSASRRIGWGRLRPAAIAMATAFVVTWGPLRLAEGSTTWAGPSASGRSALRTRVVDRLFPTGWHLPPGVLATVLIGAGKGVRRAQSTGRPPGDR